MVTDPARSGGKVVTARKGVGRFELRVEGRLGAGVTAKDLILYLIGQITTDGGTGYCLEYTGEAVRALSM